MKHPKRLLAFLALAAASCLTAASPQLEKLSRGLVAVRQTDGSVFLSWRLLADDPSGVAFNVYRTTTPKTGDTPVDYGIYASAPDIAAGTVKLNDAPLTAGTNLVDATAGLQHATTYFVRAVIDGKEGPESRPFTLTPGAPAVPWLSIPMRNPEGYLAAEAAPGDLDGDGDYELVVIQAGVARDNSHSGNTDPTILQAYRLDGTLLWQINLGKNIRGGAHYSQPMVFDFDGDGRAEIACKTSDGTVDGQGKVIGDPNANHVNAAGHILKGPELLTIFDGLTGAAIDTVPYEPARHPTNPLNPTGDEIKAVWGDGYGNRGERYLGGVAYLDGVRPSLIMARGYYTRSTIGAWDFRDRKLVKRWLFDSDAGPESNRAYRGQGNHSLSVADVDGDGRHEIVYGACVIDDDGTGLHSTGWGHGDALHVGDFSPSNPGIEIVTIQEAFAPQALSMRQGASGKPLFTIPAVQISDDPREKRQGPGRGIAMDIDPRFPGAEAWAIGAGLTNIHASDGRVIAPRPAGMPANFAAWWDGDLLRELVDQNFVAKWDWNTNSVHKLFIAHDCIPSNGTKATPVLSADLFGDWREEIIWRTRDGSELRVHTTTIPTRHRVVTLMHDTQYRCAAAWQNVAYNQPPHPSFALTEQP